MTKILVLLMLLSVASFACQTIHTSEFLNQTLNITNDCIQIIDDNSTNMVQIDSYYTPPTCAVPTYNLTLNVNPEQSTTHSPTNITCHGNTVKTNLPISLTPWMTITDPVSNNVYTCQGFTYYNASLTNGQTYIDGSRNVSVSCTAPSTVTSCLKNITRNLNYSETYTNNDTNITVSCAHYPSINQVVNLNYNQSYMNTSLNLTVNAPQLNQVNQAITLQNGTMYINNTINLSVACVQPKLNAIFALSYNQSYINSLLNLTVTSPVYPQVNNYIELASNQSYINSDINLTVRSLISSCSCLQNISNELSIDGTFRNDICNITITGPPRSTEVLTPEFGKDKISQKYGVTCRGLEPLDQQFNLTDNNTIFKDERQNLIVTCSYNESKVPECATTNIDLTALESANQNDTDPKAIWATVNLKRFSYACKKDEATDIYGCWDRLIKERDSVLNQSAVKISQLQEEVNVWKDPKISSQNQTSFFITLLLVGIGCVLAIVAIVVYFIVIKKNLMSDPIEKPKKPLVRPMNITGES